MAAQAVLIAVFIVVAAAAAAPFVWRERARSRHRRDANALVLGGAVLGGGQGAIALGISASVAGDPDFDTTLLFVLPSLLVGAALLALWAAFRLAGWTQRALLLTAALLSFAGVLNIGLFAVAGAASFVAAVCYLFALSDDPRGILRRLDPRD